MKYLAVFFSFYLLVLALMPCRDVSDIAADAKTSFSFHADSGGMEKCNQDACAPFCSCNCCQTGKNFPIQFITISVELAVQVSHSLYAASAPRKQAVDVWQPPKLA